MELSHDVGIFSPQQNTYTNCRFEPKRVHFLESSFTEKTNDQL